MDAENRKESVEVIRTTLPMAKLYGLTQNSNGRVPTMHSKFIMVDSKFTFISSANFSNIAVTESLELGIRTQRPFLAKQIKERVDGLILTGSLVRI